MLSKQEKLDVNVISKAIGRSIEEIIFCTIHPELTGSYRRENAIKTFGENVTNLISLIRK